MTPIDNTRIYITVNSTDVPAMLILGFQVEEGIQITMSKAIASDQDAQSTATLLRFVTKDVGGKDDEGGK